MMAFSGAEATSQIRASWPVCEASRPTRKARSSNASIKANFREGLSVLEYFISTHGACKSGRHRAAYRRLGLPDLPSGGRPDVIIRDRLRHCRRRAVPLHNEKGDVDEPSSAAACSTTWRASTAGVAGRGRVHHPYGPAQGHGRGGRRDARHPHGHDLPCRAARRVPEVLRLGSRHVASGEHRHGGGHHAAQSIGEPGTQLTMRRLPTPAASPARTSPTVCPVSRSCSRRASPWAPPSSRDLRHAADLGRRQSKTITIHDQQGNFREYVVSARAQMLPGVTDGCEVKVGQQLTKGSVNPHDLLRLTDPNTTLRYIVSQVQACTCPRAWTSTTSTSRSSRARCCARWPSWTPASPDFRRVAR